MNISSINTLKRAKTIWAYTDDESAPLEGYRCFAEGCECPPVRFIVFRPYIEPQYRNRINDHREKRIKVALCEKHYNRYQVTGRMPRRKDWDKLIFRSMP